MLNRRFSVIRRPLSTAGAFAKTLQHLLIAVLLIVVLGTALPQPTQAEPAVASGDVSPGGLLNPDGTLNMSTGFQGTLDLRGWQVTLDGKRGPILDPASLSDSSQANAWNALPNQGLDDLVLSLAVLGDDLYVGGLFTQTGDGTLTDLGHIARYDTIAGVWHALPNQGLNDHVHSLAVLGNDLYVGGKFKQTGDGTLTDLGRIARYDTIAGVWHALPNQGLNDWVLTLAVSGDDLYVGGNFTYLTQPPGGVWEQLGRIARYDTITGTWHALANQGLNLYVYSLAVLGDDLYVGGYFTETKDGALTDLGHIARYDTTYGAWHALPNQGLNLYVHSLAVSGDDLYVGGYFDYTGDGTLTDLGHIARYDTIAGAWHALSNQGLTSFVFALAVSGDDLYVGGSFTHTGDATLPDLGGIARYDTTSEAWNALPNQGLTTTVVQALAVSGDDLYVGGEFSQTGDGALTDLGYIARYDTSAVSETYVYLPLVVK